MPRKYDPEVCEPRWQKFWAEKKVYLFDATGTAKKPIYSIDTPPPTVSGSLHIGHVFSYVHTDFQARYERMRGKNVFYPMGWDDNGLPSERLTERELGLKAAELPRAEFIQRCLEVCRKYEKEFYELWSRLGLSLDWTMTYSTIEERTRRISQRSFLDLVKKERGYRREEPVMWCTECQTAIAQAEVNNRTFDSVFSDVMFTLDDGKPLFIATTRPELLPACAAIFVHPGDERHRHLVGKQAQTPLFEVSVPILSDEAVDPEKGTGVVMCCTFGDRTDIEWWKKAGLPLRIVVTDDGRLNERAGPYTMRPENLAFLRRFPGSLCPSSLPIPDCAFRISGNACRVIRNPARFNNPNRDRHGAVMTAVRSLTVAVLNHARNPDSEIRN